MVYRDEQLIFLPETDSTNRYLQLLAQERTVADETVVWADFQTSGRGQIGNSWESEAGKNLTFSIFFFPKELPANQPFVVAEMAALCVKRILDRLTPGITVKWPNDVYWNRQKICGILIENQLSAGLISHSIAGIGLNLNQDVFHSNAPNPVSLKQITGYSYDRADLLSQLRASFHDIRVQFEAEGAGVIHQEYTQALYRRDGFYSFCDKHGYFEACIHHVELSGHLVLQRKNGILSTYAFKEVTYVDNLFTDI